MKTHRLSLAILVWLLLAGWFCVFQFVPKIHAATPFGLDGQVQSSIPLVQITNSIDSNYTYMAQNSSQSYFKNDSMSSRAVRFVYENYNFDMDISTSQLNYYNSRLGVLDVVGNPENPQHIVANVVGSILTYTAAWNDSSNQTTDLQYQTFQDQLKETLKIHSVPSNASYADFLQYEVTCYYNSSLEIYANGIGYLNPSGVQFNTTARIDFNNPSTNATVYWLPQPYIYDSAGNNCIGNYGILANNGILAVYIRVPLSFLNSAVFPVYLDPLALDGSVEAKRSSGTTYILSLKTVNSNDVIIVAAMASGVTSTYISVSSMTDNLTTHLSWKERQLAYQAVSSVTYRLEEWYANWSSSGAINITVTLSTTTNLNWAQGVAFGISGADLTSIFDPNYNSDGNSNNPNATGTSSTPSVAITTTNPNDFITGLAMSSTTLSVGSGFTTIKTGFDAGGYGTEYKTVSTDQTGLSITFGGSGNWCEIADAVMQASGASWGPYSENATVSVSTSTSRAYTASRSTSLTASIGASVSRLASYLRTSSLTSSISLVASKLRTVPKSLSLSVSVSTAVSRLASYVRSGSLTSSISAAVSRVASYLRTSSLTVSISTATSKVHSVADSLSLVAKIATAISDLPTHIRSLSLTVSVSSAVGRVLSYVRSASLSASITQAASRLASYLRSGSLAFSLSTATSRLASYVRSSSLSASVSAVVSRAVGFVRSASSIVASVTGTANRVASYMRSQSLLASITVSASKVYSASRSALLSIVVAVVGVGGKPAGRLVTVSATLNVIVSFAQSISAPIGQYVSQITLWEGASMLAGSMCMVLLVFGMYFYTLRRRKQGVPTQKVYLTD